MRIISKTFFLLIILSWLFTILAEAADHKRYHTIEHNGTRKFRVYLPTGYSKNITMPMVLVFHGGGGSIEGIVRMTGMDRAAEEKGFIAVYPAGSGPEADRLLTWNAGTCCAYAMENNIDDVGFVSELIDFMIAEYRVDRRRVYATGHSNGAQMCYRLVCELAHKLAAVAPHGAQGVFRECKPSRKVPILHIHGTEDRCVPYEGGECGGCFQDFLTSIGIAMERKTWPCTSIKDSVKSWAARYGCTMTTKVIYNKGPVTCRTYLQCPQGIEVTLCPVQGSGHTWPGGAYALEVCHAQPNSWLCKKWKQIVGPIILEVNANELIWEFFKKYRLPD